MKSHLIDDSDYYQEPLTISKFKIESDLKAQMSSHKTNSLACETRSGNTFKAICPESSCAS